MLNDDLPEVDHSQGFKTADEIREYLSAFSDRPDTEVASHDLFGRQTTFGDLRKLAGRKERQESMSFDFDQSSLLGRS